MYAVHIIEVGKKYRILYHDVRYFVLDQKSKLMLREVTLLTCLTEQKIGFIFFVIWLYLIFKINMQNKGYSCYKFRGGEANMPGRDPNWTGN